MRITTTPRRVTTGGGVLVLLGDGDGTFRSPVDYAVEGGGGVTSLAVGDFNGDGRADIAATTSNDVAVLLGDGDGSFRSPVDYPVGIQVTSLAVGDFNGDGRADLAYPDPLTGQPSVLLNTKTGTLSSAASFPRPSTTIPSWPTSPATAPTT